MNSSLDTNVLLRYILMDVPKQYKKAARLLADGSQVFYVKSYIIAEVIYNLQIAELSREDIAQILTRIFSLSNVIVDEKIVKAVLPFYVAHPALSFVDCLAAFDAEDDGAEPLWTFDRKLANQHPSAKLVV